MSQTSISNVLQVFVPLSNNAVTVNKFSRHANGFLLPASELTAGQPIFQSSETLKILVQENVADLKIIGSRSSTINGEYKLHYRSNDFSDYAFIHNERPVWVKENSALAVFYVLDSHLGFTSTTTGRWVLGRFNDITAVPISVHFAQKESTSDAFPFLSEWLLPSQIETKPSEFEPNTAYDADKQTALDTFNTFDEEEQATIKQPYLLHSEDNVTLSPSQTLPEDYVGLAQVDFTDTTDENAFTNMPGWVVKTGSDITLIKRIVLTDEADLDIANTDNFAPNTKYLPNYDPSYSSQEENSTSQTPAEYVNALDLPTDDEMIQTPAVGQVGDAFIINPAFDAQKEIALTEYLDRVRRSQLEVSESEYKQFDITKVDVEPTDEIPNDDYIAHYDPDYTSVDQSIANPDYQAAQDAVYHDSLTLFKVSLKRAQSATTLINDANSQPVGVARNNINFNVDGFDEDAHMVLVAGSKVDLRLQTTTAEDFTNIGLLHLALMDLNSVSTASDHKRLTAPNKPASSFETLWNELNNQSTSTSDRGWVQQSVSIHSSIAIVNKASLHNELYPRFAHEENNFFAYNNQQVVLDRIEQAALTEGQSPNHFSDTSILEMISDSKVVPLDVADGLFLPHIALGRVILKHKSDSSELFINRERVQFAAFSDPSLSPKLIYRSGVTLSFVGANTQLTHDVYQVRNVKPYEPSSAAVGFKLQLKSGGDLTFKLRPEPAMTAGDKITVEKLTLLHKDQGTIEKPEPRFVLDGMAPSTVEETLQALDMRQSFTTLTLKGDSLTPGVTRHFEIAGVLLKSITQEDMSSTYPPIILIEDCVVDTSNSAHKMNIGHANVLFKSGSSKTANDLFTNASNYASAKIDQSRCQTINLSLNLNNSTGKVTFDGVLFRSVTSNGNRFVLSNTTADATRYALRLESTVGLSTESEHEVRFINRSSYIGVESANCNGILMKTGSNRKIRLSANASSGLAVPPNNLHRRSMLQSVRAFAVSSISSFSNVGVIFSGQDQSNIAMNIGDVSLCNNVDDLTQGNAADNGLEYVAFGTTAMSVDDSNVSNLATIVSNLASQGLKWVSTQGHHIVGWKMDEPRVLYRKTHVGSHRKLVYTDNGGTSPLAGQKMEHAFILGMIPDKTDDFTGETGGLLGLELELLSHEALQQTFGKSSEILDEKLNELEDILFGSADGTQPFRVGIAGFLHSDKGGFEQLRIFNGQPSGQFTIMFETDEGFIVTDAQNAQKRLHYWLGMATLQARFQEPNLGSNQVKLFRGKGDFSPWAISPLRYQLIELDKVKVGVFNMTPIQNQTTVKKIIDNDDTDNVSLIGGTQKKIAVQLLDHALLWDGGVYLARPQDNDPANVRSQVNDVRANQYLDNLRIKVASRPEIVSFGSVKWPQGLFVNFKSDSGSYDFARYKTEFLLSHTLDGSVNTGWPQDKVVKLALQFLQNFKDTDTFEHTQYVIEPQVTDNGVLLDDQSILPIASNTGDQVMSNAFLLQMKAQVLVDATVVNAVLIQGISNTEASVAASLPNPKMFNSINEFQTSTEFELFTGKILNGQKNAQNFITPELMSPLHASDAIYNNATIDDNARVESTTFTLALSMFSKPGTERNENVLAGDSTYHAPIDGFQYIVVAPLDTLNRVYTNSNTTVNTFNVDGSVSWNITVSTSGDIGFPDGTYTSGITIEQHDIKWGSSGGNRKNGRYHVIKIPARMFANLDDQNNVSSVIPIQVTAITKDKLAQLSNSIMGAPMRLAFDLVPLIKSTIASTNASTFALYSTVPKKYAMKFENVIGTSAVGQGVFLAERDDDEFLNDERSVSLFRQAQNAQPRLIVDFVARPFSNNASEGRKNFVDLNFRTVHQYDQAELLQFTITQTDDAYHDLMQQSSPMIFQNITRNQFKLDITALVDQTDDNTNKRQLSLKLPFQGNATVSVNRIFYVGMDGFASSDAAFNDKPVQFAPEDSMNQRAGSTIQGLTQTTELFFQYAAQNTNSTSPTRPPNGTVTYTPPEISSSDPGSGEPVDQESTATVDLQVRLQSAETYDAGIISFAGGALTSSEDKQFREYQFAYTVNERTLPVLSRIERPDSILVPVNRAADASNAILTRPLKSILERVFIGWVFKEQSALVGDPLQSAYGPFVVELDAQVTINGQPVSGSSGQGDLKPQFFVGHSESSALFQKKVYTGAKSASSESFDLNLYAGSWIDFSRLQSVLQAATNSSNIMCEIYAIVRGVTAEEQAALAGSGLVVTNRFGNSEDGIGLKALIAKVDLTTAGRVELLNMDNVAMSSVRIGNWVMRPDSSGDLRFYHEVFADFDVDAAGEASQEQDAHVEFDMPFATVQEIRSATDAVHVVGSAFRLTGHANEPVA